jgi:hypothetical protein
LLIDPADDEINVVLPAIFAVLILFGLSILSLVLSYLLRYQIILFDVSDFKIAVMKWFGFVGGGIAVLVIMSVLALSWWQQ